ncbi:MAG: ribosome assembly cofactor RimP, partial [Prevotellaceae bacterium]|nr:ribosome assembly cofactor RimP [Prevotellaceae bacterium]
MIDKIEVTQYVTEYLSESGSYLVDVAIKPGNLIVIEIDNDKAVSIDDCVQLS